MLKRIFPKLQNTEYTEFLSYLKNHEEQHEAICYEYSSTVNEKEVFLFLVLVGYDCLFVEKVKSNPINIQHIQFNTKDKMNYFWLEIIPNIIKNGKVYKDEHLIEHVFEHLNNNKYYYKISLLEEEKLWKTFFEIIRPKNFFEGTISYSPNIGTQLD